MRAFSSAMTLWSAKVCASAVACACVTTGGQGDAKHLDPVVVKSEQRETAVGLARGGQIGRASSKCPAHLRCCSRRQEPRNKATPRGHGSVSVIRIEARNDAQFRANFHLERIS